MRALTLAASMVLAAAGLAAAQAPDQPEGPREQQPFPGLRQDFDQGPGEVPPGAPFEPIEQIEPFEEGGEVEPAELDSEWPTEGQPEVAPEAHETDQQQLYHEGHLAGEEVGEEIHAREENAEDVQEEELHGHVDFGTVFSSIEFWGSVVNFLILIGLIVVFGRKPIGSFLVSRRKAIEEGLAEAARLREAAQKRYDEYTERLEKLDREIAEIRKDMVAAGEAERDRIVADAEAKAARMRREAEFLIEQQMKQLRVDLTREAVEAAVTAAEEVLRKSVSPEDQQRLAQQYLERLSTEARS